MELQKRFRVGPLSTIQETLAMGLTHQLRCFMTTTNSIEVKEFLKTFKYTVFMEGEDIFIDLTANIPEEALNIESNLNAI